MNIQSLNHLEGITGYTREEFKTIAANKKGNHYHFQQEKGLVKGIMKYRHFNPSKKHLRDLQNRLQSRIFSKIELPPHIQGCTRGRGNITNAKAHKGKLYKFKTDLKSYFDFVSNKKVNDALVTLGFSYQVSHLLTEATTFEGHLAQGPPTSPFLANIAGLAMDEALLELCEKHNITYTRYVDDLCFSSGTCFKEITSDLVKIIEKNGFFIGYKKTMYKKGHMEITGGDVHNNLVKPTQKQITKYNDPNTEDYTRKGLSIYFAGLKDKKRNDKQK